MTAAPRPGQCGWPRGTLADHGRCHCGRPVAYDPERQEWRHSDVPARPEPEPADLVPVQVDAVEAYSGSVWLALGTDELGRRLIVAGEPRMLDAIRAALVAGAERVPALVPPWAIIVGGAPPGAA